MKALEAKAKLYELLSNRNLDSDMREAILKAGKALDQLDLCEYMECVYSKAMMTGERDL